MGTHIAGWSSPVAREAHNLEVAGSNPVPATFFPSLVSAVRSHLRCPAAERPATEAGHSSRPMLRLPPFFATAAQNHPAFVIRPVQQTSATIRAEPDRWPARPAVVLFALPHRTSDYDMIEWEEKIVTRASVRPAVEVLLKKSICRHFFAGTILRHRPDGTEEIRNRYVDGTLPG